MSVCKNLIINLSLVACTAMAGCDWYAPTTASYTEVRSLIDDLERVSMKSPETTAAGVVVQATVLEEPIQQETVQQETTVEEVTSATSSATITGQLTWEPAGFYEDGTVMDIDEISHYQIVFGTSEDNLSNSIDVTIAGLLTYDFTATADHTWFVGVKTVSIYSSVSNVSNITAFHI